MRDQEACISFSSAPRELGNATTLLWVSISPSDKNVPLGQLILDTLPALTLYLIPAPPISLPSFLP